MSEPIVVALITAGFGFAGIVLKVLWSLRNENRKDHGVVVAKLSELADGHTELHKDLKDVKADIRDVRDDHRHLAAKVDTMATQRFWRRRTR
jgi:hypothetical protein